jgi:adenylate kinase family enzyme
MTKRIHLVGASGSGTTTLGRVLAERLGVPHFDTDTYFWLPTDPPFREQRPVPDRIAMLSADLDQSDAWVLSGSLVGWGDVLAPRFDLVIFLWVPPDLRLARLRARERERYGTAIEPGGSMHEGSTAFMAWAAGYDDDNFQGRSRRVHERWLAQFSCPVVRLEGEESVEERLAQLHRYLPGLDRGDALPAHEQ